jgi:hypothetical protein
MKASKPRVVKSRVVRRIKEVQNDYRWWRYVDEAPECGYVEDTYEYTESAYAELKKPRRSRQTRPVSLSRTRLRARMYRVGYRGPALAELVRTLAERDRTSASLGITHAGWTRKRAEEQFGRRVARELRRGVDGFAVYLDEMGYYMAPGLGKLLEGMRAWMSSHPIPAAGDSAGHEPGTNPQQEQL